MDNETFISEMENYNISDLELILQTQKDLYSKEEMEIIADILKKKKALLNNEKSDIIFPLTLLCVDALIYPICGAVTGIIMLIAGSAPWKKAAGRIFLAAAISIMIRLFLFGGGFHI